MLVAAVEDEAVFEEVGQLQDGDREAAEFAGAGGEDGLHREQAGDGAIGLDEPERGGGGRQAGRGGEGEGGAPHRFAAEVEPEGGGVCGGGHREGDGIMPVG